MNLQVQCKEQKAASGRMVGGEELRRSSARDPTIWEESLGVFTVSSIHSRGCFGDKDLYREISESLLQLKFAKKLFVEPVRIQQQLCILPSSSGLVFLRLILPNARPQL